MTVEAILARLQGVRRNGSGWIALCPAHSDRNPSLSVRGENGRVLLHCFAGCSTETVCAALKIRMSELFSGPGEMHKPRPGIVHDAQRQIAGLRSRLSPRDRQRAVTVVLADSNSLEPAIARALALAVEGEIVQVAFKEGGA